jgi:hypothetical protein
MQAILKVVKAGSWFSALYFGAKSMQSDFMVAIFKVVFVIVLGILFIISGLGTIKKGHFEIGIGGGRVVSRPLIVFQFKGVGAKIFGVFLTFGGLIISIYIGVLGVEQRFSELDTALSVGVFVIGAILAIGFIFALVLQFIEGISKVSGRKDRLPK